MRDEGSGSELRDEGSGSGSIDYQTVLAMIVVWGTTTTGGRIMFVADADTIEEAQAVAAAIIDEIGTASIVVNGHRYEIRCPDTFFGSAHNLYSVAGRAQVDYFFAVNGRPKIEMLTTEASLTAACVKAEAACVKAENALTRLNRACVKAEAACASAEDELAESNLARHAWLRKRSAVC